MIGNMQKSGNEKQNKKKCSHWKEIKSCNMRKYTENLLNARAVWLKLMQEILSAIYVHASSPECRTNQNHNTLIEI